MCPLRTSMPLDLENLQNVIGSLDQALGVFQVFEEPGSVPTMGGTQGAWRRVVQSGAIKHFEFTYEPSSLFIKRWLEANASPNAGDGVTRRELFRLGAENRLIDDVDRWMRYHQARNRTSHMYRQATANEVRAVVRPLLEDSRLLLAALEARND